MSRREQKFVVTFIAEDIDGTDLYYAEVEFPDGHTETFDRCGIKSSQEYRRLFEAMSPHSVLVAGRGKSLILQMWSGKAPEGVNDG